MTDRDTRTRRIRVIAGVAFRLAAAAGLVAIILPAIWTDDPGRVSRAGALLGFAVLLLEVFSFHGGLVLLAASLPAFILKHRVNGGLLALLGLLLAGPGLVSNLRIPPIPGDTERFTVISYNMLFSSADLTMIETIAVRERPDVIVLQEVVGVRAHEVRERFEDTHPHVAGPDSHRWGCMVLSRTPFTGESVEIPGHTDWPIAQPAVRVEHEGRAVVVVGVHLPAPNRLDQVAAGPAMAASVADWIEECRLSVDSPDAFVLAGDFNAPLRTGRLRALRDAGLIEVHDAAGRGRGATWPDKTLLRFAPGIRLDQVGYVGGLRCVESRVLDSIGSDHRPIVASFVWE